MKRKKIKIRTKEWWSTSILGEDLTKINTRVFLEGGNPEGRDSTGLVIYLMIEIGKPGSKALPIRILENTIIGDTSQLNNTTLSKLKEFVKTSGLLIRKYWEGKIDTTKLIYALSERKTEMKTEKEKRKKEHRRPDRLGPHILALPENLKIITLSDLRENIRKRMEKKN